MISLGTLECTHNMSHKYPFKRRKGLYCVAALVMVVGVQCIG
jgi:hypothetical protein